MFVPDELENVARFIAERIFAGIQTALCDQRDCAIRIQYGVCGIYFKHQSNASCLEYLVLADRFVCID